MHKMSTRIIMFLVFAAFGMNAHPNASLNNSKKTGLISSAKKYACEMKKSLNKQARVGAAEICYKYRLADIYTRFKIKYIQAKIARNEFTIRKCYQLALIISTVKKIGPKNGRK